jgi:hypothetical protein
MVHATAPGHQLGIAHNPGPLSASTVRVFAHKMIHYLILPPGKCTCIIKLFGTVCYGECPAAEEATEDKGIGA